LREKERERELLRVWGWFGGEWKRLGHIIPRVAGPTILRRRGLSATSRRTVRLYNFWHITRLKLPLEQPFSTWADHPRDSSGLSAATPLVLKADCLRTTSGPSEFLLAAFSKSAEPLVTKFYERWTVCLLPADRPRNQISNSPEFYQLLQFQLQFGIIAHIKFQKSQN
jgi:hypothetical protein